MAERSIFRKAALERLSSPERLDELMQVTRPRAWLALIAVAIVVAAAVAWSVVGELSTRVVGEGILLRGGGPTVVVTRAAGTVTTLGVRPGQQVARGAMLARIEAGAGQTHVVVSPKAGRVLDVRLAAGQLVAAGATVASLEPAAGRLQAVAYVPPRAGKSVRPGMAVELLPANVKAEESGYLLGVVGAVSAFPATREGMLARLGASGLVERFAAAGTPYEVQIKLARRRGGGYRWSSPRTPPAVESGTLCSIRIITRKQRPIDLIIPGKR
jgi:biotin carboxyl carrier protein